MIGMTREAEREMEERFKLQKEAIALLRLVDVEWRSDPASVACFDLRTVARTRAVLSRLDELQGPLGE